MAKKLNIPDELQAPFQKLMQFVPQGLQSDIDTHNAVLVYLKSGGEKMARHGIEIIKMRYHDEMQQENDDFSDTDSIDNEIEAFRDPNVDDDDVDDDDVDDDDSDDYSIDF